ncbi:MAG: retropepsin-like domain-containing protein [Actinomycetota bacterium]|nr:retropepsin-like domain-containing protein [Actinomycetota bacterium]
MLRPVVSARLVGPDLSAPVLALVDTGCEHILAAPWVVQDAGLDMSSPTYAIDLGIGGQTVEAEFLTARLRLQHPGGDDDDFVEWEAEVGKVNSWRAPWQILLGQDNFMRRFTVSMHRDAGLLVVEDYDAFDRRFGMDSQVSDDRPGRFSP